MDACRSIELSTRAALTYYLNLVDFCDFFAFAFLMCTCLGTVNLLSHSDTNDFVDLNTFAAYLLWKLSSHGH